MKKKIVNFLFLLCLVVPVLAREVPPRPEPAQFVNDYAGVLTGEQRQKLEDKLKAYEDSTGSQVVIVTIPSLEGDDIFDYTHKLATTWGVGEKERSNGLVLLVAVEDRAMRIHVGNGLQGRIPDGEAWEIIDYVLKPHFRKGEYYEGINEATDAIFTAAAGEFKADKKKKGGKPAGNTWLVFAIVLFIFFISWIARRGGGRRRGWGYGRGGYYGGFGGGWGGGSGGGWGGGGSSFGGGGFDGGGASGNW